MNTFFYLLLNFILLFAVFSFLVAWYFAFQFAKHNKIQKDIFKRMIDINHTLTPEETKLYKDSSDNCNYYSNRAKQIFYGFLILIINYFLFKYLLNNSFFSL